jgi:hypothetical protein
VDEAKKAIAHYIHWYNHDRRHSGLGYHKPYEVMTGLKQALTWPFSKPQEKTDGYGDNRQQLPPIPTASTIITIKQQKVKSTMNLSSNIAA